MSECERRARQCNTYTTEWRYAIREKEEVIGRVGGLVEEASLGRPTAVTRKVRAGEGLVDRY